MLSFTEQQILISAVDLINLPGLRCKAAVVKLQVMQRLRACQGLYIGSAIT